MKLTNEMIKDLTDNQLVDLIQHRLPNIDLGKSETWIKVLRRKSKNFLRVTNDDIEILYNISVIYPGFRIEYTPHRFYIKYDESQLKFVGVNDNFDKFYYIMAGNALLNTFLEYDENLYEYNIQIISDVLNPSHNQKMLFGNLVLHDAVLGTYTYTTLINVILKYNITLTEEQLNAIETEINKKSLNNNIILSLLLNKRICIDFSLPNVEIIQYLKVRWEQLKSLFTDKELQSYFKNFKDLDLIETKEMFDYVYNTSDYFRKNWFRFENFKNYYQLGFIDQNVYLETWGQMNTKTRKNIRTVLIDKYGDDPDWDNFFLITTDPKEFI